MPIVFEKIVQEPAHSDNVAEEAIADKTVNTPEIPAPTVAEDEFVPTAHAPEAPT